VARAELGLIRPGEILVVVRRPTTPVTPPDATKTATETATKTAVTTTAVTKTDPTEEARDSRE
jgi:hypothetical protein